MLKEINIFRHMYLMDFDEIEIIQVFEMKKK